MEAEDSLRCDGCKRECMGKRKMSVWRLPVVLTIGFNRFDMRGDKINKYIDTSQMYDSFDKDILKLDKNIKKWCRAI